MKLFLTGVHCVFCFISGSLCSIKSIAAISFGGAIILLTACEDIQQDKQPETRENVIIQCVSNCDSLAAAIQNQGGNITINYKNINALAANIPASLVGKLAGDSGIQAIAKDTKINKPIPRSTINIKSEEFRRIVNLKTSNLITQPDYKPKNYAFNNDLTGVTQLHEQDITGRNVIVAVIDTGIANNQEIVPALSGNIIGGENFVDLPDEPSATSTLNDSHGTWVSTMIAGHLGIVLPNDAPLAQSIISHAPDSIVPFTDTESMIPMLGSAPESSLYAMKVFAADGAGTPSSIVIAALDRILTLKRNFNNGMPSEPVAGDGSEDNPFVYDSLNIQVVNMSLGGPTMIPGLEVEDLIVVELLAEGITVVSSAGNEGFGAMTGGSPGTSVASLTVGASSSPQHERILRDMQFDLGTGLAFRPTDHNQIAYFSSRGPTADGRTGLQVVANGYASLVQGADGDFTLISGTSFSSPTVAGAAALMWQAKPESSATGIRDALMRGASMQLFDGFNIHAIDSGRGFINAPASLALLNEDEVDNEMPALPAFDDDDDEPTHVIDNIEPLELNILEPDTTSFTAQITLKPGEVSNYFVPTSLSTGTINVAIQNFSALPDAEQNVIFGDGILFSILDAPTSINELLLDEVIYADSEFSIALPQSGLVRVALMGDWVNAGEVSATLQINIENRSLPRPFVEGRLRDEETDMFVFNVPNDANEINFELSWESDWGHYPPHDIDLILFDPNGEPYFDGATLDIPERVSLSEPAPGRWTALVTGFMLHGFRDRYSLSIVDQNNNPIRRLRRRSRD